MEKNGTITNLVCFLRQFKFLLPFKEVETGKHDQYTEVKFRQGGPCGSNQQIYPQRKTLGQHRGWGMKDHSYVLSRS